MKRKIFSGIIILITVLVLSGLNCSSEGTSKVTVHINLDRRENAGNTPQYSVFGRFLRFFATEAAAQTAQYIPNITSLRLSITGPGMDPISLGYGAPIPLSITVEVPSGGNRSFELFASTPSVTFRGIAAADLSAGASVSLPITMKLSETKIIIPDYSNGRIVQVDDMNGINWTEKTASGFSPGLSSFYPSDIDFDPNGRIYISGAAVFNTQPGYSTNALIRIDDIISRSYTTIASCGDCYDYGAIALDKIRNIIYYSNLSSLYRNNLDGTDEVQLNTSNENPAYSISYINGMDVDENGILHIAGETYLYDPELQQYITINTIYKYNPVSQTVENVYTDTGIGKSWDVIVRSNTIYVAHNYAEGNNKIIQLNPDLENMAELTMNPNDSRDKFYGPHRFVAALNSKFYITDEIAVYPFDKDRIVSFDDIAGNGWTSFGSTGSDINQFNFYEYYSY